MERTVGFEPTASSLEGTRSTPELRPHLHHGIVDERSGAGEAIRTPDPHLGKVVLYP
tara:strand:- start:293 stop:463 length:171 start_codon:yes stop_codon:yes gene_type:complete